MKKVILSLLLVSGITCSFAQKANVNKAKNKALMENPDFAEARNLIKPALIDETTKNQANTWYIAGLIGYKENKAIETKAILENKEPDQSTKGPIVMESYKYFVIADSLDQLPDAKGRVKPKFRKEIKKNVKEYYSYNLINYGAYLFDKRQYKEALDVFNTYLEIPDLSLMEGEIQKDTTYNMIQYYAAVSASNADMGDEAIRLYNGLKDKDYESLAVHQLLYEEYAKKKDTVNYVKILQEGTEKFPTEPWFLQNLINHYIYSGQTELALSYLNTAIERDPAFAQYHFVAGGLHEATGDLDAALAAYKKALELDPLMPGSYEAIGRFHYNKAIAILDAADALRNNKAAKAEQAKADEEFKAAIPYYQKAVELNPDETNYKVMLRTLYYRLKMDKEYEAIDKEING